MSIGNGLGNGKNLLKTGLFFDNIMLREYVWLKRVKKTIQDLMPR